MAPYAKTCLERGGGGGGGEGGHRQQLSGCFYFSLISKPVLVAAMFGRTGAR